MNGNVVFLTDSEEWNITGELGLQLSDSLPQLNFDVLHSELSDLSGPVIANRGPPERVPYAGDYNFVVEISSTHTNKKKYVFSHKLNRMYVDMDTDFSVQFNWQGRGDMFVRAVCVFADTSQAEKRVQRCLQHYHMNQGSDPNVAWNVLHSSRPAGTGGVEYCGEADAPDSWLSVKVRLQKPGPEPTTHAYRFTCKNSCTSGINRRAINIIFTLEDDRGTVFGRQCVGARVCACPRRDMLKDEEGEAPRGGKRRASVAPLASLQPPLHKVKKEDSGEDATTLIDLSTLNPRAAMVGLDVMIKMQEEINETEQARNNLNKQRDVTHLKKVLEDLKKKHTTQ